MKEQVHGHHQGNSRVVELKVGLHHGCFDSDHRSPTMVELELGLHQRYSIRRREVFQGGKASDVASLWES